MLLLISLPLLLLANLSFQALLQELATGLHLAIEENFADPSFIEVDGVYYAFATGNGKQNIPTAISHDFVHWKVQDKDALPKVPKWSGGSTWAPDVVRLDDGSFIMYFAATSLKDTKKHCVGAAKSKHVTGPYVPIEHSLACPLLRGGAIDPSGFRDHDGNLFLTYKIDGNSLGGGGTCGNGDFSHRTPIILQQVAKRDGVTSMGRAHEILDRGHSDGPLIEAPSLTRTEEGVYILFFSSNCYNGPYYDTSYATSATGVHGPYHKSKKPLLTTGADGGRLQSPGGATVGSDGKKLVFHSDKKAGDPSVRQMWTGYLKVQDETSSIAERSNNSPRS